VTPRSDTGAQRRAGWDDRPAAPPLPIGRRRPRAQDRSWERQADRCSCCPDETRCAQARRDCLPLPPSEPAMDTRLSATARRSAKTTSVDRIDRGHRRVYHVIGARMQASTTRSIQTWRRRMTTRRRWHPFRHRSGLQRSFRLIRAGIAVGGRPQTWMAIGSAVGHASSHRWSQARTRVGYRRRGRRQEQPGAGSAPEKSSAIQTKLSVGERNTLEIGAGVVLGALGVGFQMGQWPAWTALVAVGGYLTWSAAYAEATVQARRYRIGRSVLTRPNAGSAGSTPQPAQEHSPT
jgi:hypothetical protein